MWYNDVATSLFNNKPPLSLFLPVNKGFKKKNDDIKKLTPDMLLLYRKYQKVRNYYKPKFKNTVCHENFNDDIV